MQVIVYQTLGWTFRYLLKKKKPLCSNYIYSLERKSYRIMFWTPSQFRELDVIFSYQKTPLKDCVDFPRRKKRASIYKNKSQYFCHLSILSVSRWKYVFIFNLTLPSHKKKERKKMTEMITRDRLDIVCFLIFISQ